MPTPKPHLMKGNTMHLINNRTLVVHETPEGEEPTHVVIRKAMIHGKPTYFINVEAEHEGGDSPEKFYADETDTKVVKLQ